MKKKIYISSVNLDRYYNLRNELVGIIEKIMQVPSYVNVTIIMDGSYAKSSEKFKFFEKIIPKLFTNLNLNIQSIQMICDDKFNLDQLLSSDFIFLAGGNPFKQIELINDLNLNSYLQSFENGVIMGSSAGAMTMGEYIIELPQVDYNFLYPSKSLKQITPLKIVEGLALNDFSVIPDIKWAYDFPNFKRVMIEEGNKLTTFQFNDLVDIDNLPSTKIGLKNGTALFTNSEIDGVFILNYSEPLQSIRPYSSDAENEHNLGGVLEITGHNISNFKTKSVLHNDVYIKKLKR